MDKQIITCAIGVLKNEPDELIEFVCPEQEEIREYPFVETAYCEELGSVGCKHLKECVAYKKQKDFEKTNHQAKWQLAFKKNDKGYEELYKKLVMIKKGEIIIPTKKLTESEQKWK